MDVDCFVKPYSVKPTKGLFRVLVSAAYKYGIPRVFIEQCKRDKDTYDYYKTKFAKGSSEIIQRRRAMETSYKNLMIATIQMIKVKNSRKEKLTKVLEKIADKNI